MNLKITGIKCDVCDWRDDSVRLEDYPKYVNAECPKCGQNLLTVEDYKNVQRLVKIASNPMIRFIEWVYLKLGLTKMKKWNIKMDGTGKVEWEEKGNVKNEN